MDAEVDAPPTWRTLTARRAVGREDSLRVVAKYGLGRLTLRAADPAVLYDVSVKYDAQHFRAEEKFDAVTRTLTVGADSATAELFSLRPRYHVEGKDRNTKDAAMTVALARGIPIDLTVKMGIAEGDIDLGNLWIDRARVEVTMAGATVDFSTLNQHPMKSLDIEALMGGDHRSARRQCEREADPPSGRSRRRHHRPARFVDGRHDARRVVDARRDPREGPG